MTHPFAGGSSRSARTAASAGYRPLPASAQPVRAAKPSALDSAIAETNRSPEARALDAILDRAARPNESALEEAIEQTQRENPRNRRSGPSTADRLAKIRVPKRLPGLPHTGNQVWGDLFAMILMYQGHRASDTAATREYRALSNFAFARECATPVIYSQGCVYLPSPGACVFGGGGGTVQQCSDPNIGGPGSPLASSVFISQARWSGATPDRTGDVTIYRRNPLGSTKGGAYLGMAQPHPQRLTDAKPMWGPLAPKVYPKKGPLRFRFERKWFPELELPRMWTPEPRAAPMRWLRHRPKYNPMRAPSEQSVRGYPVAHKWPLPAKQPLNAADTWPKTSPLLVRVGPPGPPTRYRPPPGTRETKLQVRGTRKILLAVNAITEGFDYLDAIYDALPKSCKRTKAQRGLKIMRPQNKAMAVAACWREIDWKAAIKNLIENEVEDQAFGRAGQALKKLNRAMGRPVGVQTGQGAPGKVPKGTDMGPKPWDNWTDYIWP